VADLDPHWKRIAQLTRLLGSTGGERRNAFAALERAMKNEGVSWTDVGNAIERNTDGKYSEEEMQQAILITQRENLEKGIKIGKAQVEAEARLRASNGHAAALPPPVVMAAFCHKRREQLNEWEQNFIADMHVGGKARRFPLKPKQKDKLQEIYQQLGGT
jgi:hypothetical protein